MALTISPSGDQQLVVGLPLCFSGSGIVIIPQEDLQSVDLAASGSGWTYDSGTQIFKKVSGSNGVWTMATTDDTVYGKRPFYIRGANTAFVTPGGGNYNSHCLIGVLDDDDNLYSIEIMKYCNGTACGAVGGSNWVMSIHVGPSLVYTRSVNFNELFYVRSDGVYLFFEHIQGGVTITDYVIPLPQTDEWRFVVGAAYVGNEISFVSIYKGTYQGPVPITWDAPAGGTLTGDSDTAKCFEAATPGTYQVCIDSEYDEPLCVDIEVDDLYFEPVGYACGACVFVNETITFNSNGNLSGTLTVVDEDEIPAGTVIDALHWQAPGIPMVVTATYTLNSIDVTCEINVIDRFDVTNVDGDTILGLVPGDTFQLRTNYDDEGLVVWENVNCDNLVTPTGLITIPKNYKDTCFGSIDCTIRAHVMEVPGGNCENLEYGGDNEITKELRIFVEPTYPTPELGGPVWQKWKPEVPDFRVITRTMEGGCSETHIRNQVPIMRWTVSYDALRYSNEDVCVTECCDDPNAVFVGGIDPTYQTAKVLDDFWMYVMGEHGYFTLIDPRDGTVWQRVRFENKMDRDHINWIRSQNRTLSLIWNPCCATEPRGGTCIHFTVHTDQLPPTVPQDLLLTVNAAKPDPSAGEGATASSIVIEWTKSYDNIGIKTYELEATFYDGGKPVIVNLGRSNTGTLQGRERIKWDKYYELTGDTLGVNIYYAQQGDSFRLRARDVNGNYSAWSDSVVYPL